MLTHILEYHFGSILVHRTHRPRAGPMGCPRDASVLGPVQGTHRSRTFFGDTSIWDTSSWHRFYCFSKMLSTPPPLVQEEWKLLAFKGKITLKPLISILLTSTLFQYFVQRRKRLMKLCS